MGRNRRGDRKENIWNMKILHGTVCMDQLMVDVGTRNDIHVGDDVTLIGKDGTEEITTWEIAEKVGTNHYEVLCMIAARVPRVPI